MKTKKRVNPVFVIKKYDCYIVKEEDGVEHKIYQDDYEKILKILMEIDETIYKDGMIPAQIMASKLCEMHPELKTKMLRPTGMYYVLYHLVLKILDNLRYIDYHKDGTIIKHARLIEITPITPVKRGLDKWMPSLTEKTGEIVISQNKP
jgi:hypothetical protein